MLAELAPESKRSFETITAMNSSAVENGAAPTAHALSQPAVRLQEVTFRRGETQILRPVNLEIQRGEHWALLGPNGAGKTTILGFCGAQIHPTSGTVDVLGHRLGRVDMQQLRRQDRKSTRLNSSHVAISYAVFCLKKKTRFIRSY